MVKTKQTFKLQKRDWAIALLLLSVIASNWVWYDIHQIQEQNMKNQAEGWLLNQTQISKLKNCIDEGTRPCDISSELDSQF